MKISQLHVFIIPIWPPKFHHGGHFDVFWFIFVHTYFQFFYYNFAQECPIYVFEVPKCKFWNSPSNKSTAVTLRGHWTTVDSMKEKQKNMYLYYLLLPLPWQPRTLKLLNEKWLKTKTDTSLLKYICKFKFRLNRASEIAKENLKESKIKMKA